MSSKARRPNREEVRDSILRTARDIAAADGWSAVTVRKVAERVGYTAPIIYEHFGSKDEMLDQILKGAYDSLYHLLVDMTENEAHGEQRIRAMVRSYWDFAHSSPELYQLMYGMEGARATSETARDYAEPIVNYVTEEMIHFNPRNITPENVVMIMVEIWSVVHGMIALDISGYIARYVSDTRQLPDTLVANVLRILQRQ